LLAQKSFDFSFNSKIFRFLRNSCDFFELFKQKQRNVCGTFLGEKVNFEFWRFSQNRKN